MSNRSPIFPIPEPQHFSDYGFDPPIDYLQVFEEARKQKREKPRSIDALHFKLQKPISREDSRKIKKNQKRWWRNALFFFKCKPTHNSDHCERIYRARAFTHRPMSGPIYFTESRTGSDTPYKTTSGPSSEPLAGTLTPMRMGDLEIPYIRLRELNMDFEHRLSTTAMPLYMVT